MTRPPHRSPWGRLVEAYENTSAAGDRFRRTMRRDLRASPKVLHLPFEQVDVLTRDGLRLDGWFVPRSDGAAFAGAGLGVVLHHHYGGQKASLLPWLRLFHSVGLDALALDARDHGGSAPRPIGLDCFVRRAADVHAAIDELRRRGSTRVVCYGQSQGASIVAFASGHRRDVAGVIFDSGPPPAMELAAWGLAGAMLDQGRVQWGVPERLLATSRLLVRTRPFRFNACLWSSLTRLRDRPVLWVHCEKDLVIPRRWARLWYEALRPRKANLWQELEVAGGDHVRTIQADEAAVVAAVERYLRVLVSDETKRPAV